MNTMNKTKFVAVVFSSRGTALKAFTGETEGAAAGPAMRRWQEEQAKWEAKTGRKLKDPPLWEVYQVLRATPFKGVGQ